MKQAKNGQILDDDEQPYSGPWVVPPAENAQKVRTGRARVLWYVDGWEVDPDTYRLWCYDREVDATVAGADLAASSHQAQQALFQQALAQAIPGLPQPPIGNVSKPPELGG